MQKTFISNLLLMIGLNLLVKPIAIFGIDAQVQNEVGEASYGIYFSLLNFSFIFNILLDWGINNYTTKSVAQHPNAALSYLGKVVQFRFLLFILYAIVTMSIGWILQWDQHSLFMLSFLVLNQFFATMIAYARSHFGGLLLFKTDALISVLDRFLLILFCGILLYTPLLDEPFKIEWFIWIQTLCYGLTCIIAFWILIGKIGRPKFKYNKLFSFAIVRKSFPYALLILLMMIYTRMDSVMIERIHKNGAVEAGYYAQGFRLLDAFFMFAMIFSNLLFPIFSRMLIHKKDVAPLMSTASKLLIGGASAIGILSFFQGEMILNWIYNNGISESAPAFRILMFAFIPMCTTLVFGTLLTAHGDLKFLNTISALGIVVNLALNFYLIPGYGAQGAAVATLITQSTVAVIQIVHVLRLFRIKILLFSGIQIIAFASLLVLSAIFLEKNQLQSLAIILAISLVGFFALKLIDLKALKAVFQSEERE